MLGDDATYPIAEMGSISFCMPIANVLELDDVLYVLGLMKNLLLVLTMADRCVVEFDNQVINTLLSEIATRIIVGFWPKVFEKVGIYGFLADLINHGALVHGNDKLCDIWHKRSDHLYYGALPHLKDMVQGLANFKIEKSLQGLCTLQARQNRFPKQWA